MHPAVLILKLPTPSGKVAIFELHAQPFFSLCNEFKNTILLISPSI